MSFIHNPFFAAALNDIEGEPAVGVVVATGIILVFAVLVILYLLITLQGKIFTAIDNKKKGITAPKKEKKAKVTAVKETDGAAVAALAGAMAANGSVYIEPGISGEVAAAITAAVAAMDGGRYTMRSLTRAKSGREAWNRAGVVYNTEPF